MQALLLASFYPVVTNLFNAYSLKGFVTVFDRKCNVYLNTSAIAFAPISRSIGGEQ